MKQPRVPRFVLRRLTVAALTAAVSTIAFVAPTPQLSAAPAKPAAGGKTEPDAPAGLKRYESKYYIIFTDLPEDDAKEAGLRMTRMAEEYYERTKEFSGKIRTKFPFYLFSEAEDYYAAGGIPGSAGVFMYGGGEGKLMAIASKGGGGFTWHVVQHEGFHQFAQAVIGGERPAWVNEGLADYFGESIWTGDGFVTGVLPPGRLGQIQKGIESKRYKSMPVMMTMSQQAWNSGLSGDNYDQAWSMCHFLAHGENGRYQKAFSKFMNLLGKGTPSNKAWLESFGDANGFQERWEKWTREQPLDATADLYAQAKLATLTSFLARANAQKQTFDNTEEFMTKAEAGELKASKEEWLPATLLRRALEMKPKNVQGIEIDNKTNPKQPRLVMTLDGGTKMVGNFKLTGGKVSAVWVDRDDTDKVIADARKLLDDGKKDDAKDLLQAALRKNPKSARAEEMRAMVLEAKK